MDWGHKLGESVEYKIGILRGNDAKAVEKGEGGGRRTLGL